MALLPVRQENSMLPRDGVIRDSTESTYRAGAPAGSARPTSAHSGVMKGRPATGLCSAGMSRTAPGP